MKLYTKKLPVSNYSELTHSVGTRVSCSGVKGSSCFQLFRINPFGRVIILESCGRGEGEQTVSNYSELTHSVGLRQVNGFMNKTDNSFQLFRINPFGRVYR